MQNANPEFQIGQLLWHPEMELNYRVDTIAKTPKGHLYTLVADECLQAEIRYKRYYETKIKEKMKKVE